MLYFLVRHVNSIYANKLCGQFIHNVIFRKYITERGVKLEGMGNPVSGMANCTD